MTEDTWREELNQALESSYLVSFADESVQCTRMSFTFPLSAPTTRTRWMHCGPLSIAVPVVPSPELRISLRALSEMAAWWSARVDLPGLAVSGSQSPLSAKHPYSASDVDFVCFAPLEDLFARPQIWAERLAYIQRHDLLRECEAEFGLGVECGLLAEEFKCLPALLDCVEIGESPALAWPWQLSESGVRDLLAERLRQFLEPAPAVAATLHAIKGVLETHMPATVGKLTSLQVGPRWRDVTILTMDHRRTGSQSRLELSQLQDHPSTVGRAPFQSGTDA